MTALNIDRRHLEGRTAWLDRAAVSIGNALTEWGNRRADIRTAPGYADQTERIERLRHETTRGLPELPR